MRNDIIPQDNTSISQGASEVSEWETPIAGPFETPTLIEYHIQPVVAVNGKSGGSNVMQETRRRRSAGAALASRPEEVGAAWAFPKRGKPCDHVGE